MKVKEYINGKNKKKAVIKTIDGKYFVDLSKDEQFVRTVDLSGHSVHYAYDVAENWLNGILK